MQFNRLFRSLAALGALLAGAACLADDASRVESLALGEDAAFFSEDVGGAVAAALAPSEEDEDVCRLDESEETAALRWRRHRHRTGAARVNVTVEDGLAFVSRSAELAGRLLIDLDGECPIGAKPMHEVAHRNAVYAKVRPDRPEEAEKASLDARARRPEDRPDFRRGWRLVAVSPVEIRLFPDEAGPRTVAITRVTAYVDGEVRFDVDDPAKVLRLGDGFATFSPGERAHVEASVRNQDAEGGARETRVFLHHDGKREEMFDDGSNGDMIAGDGVFTREYEIGERPGVHHAAVDAIDAETFADETTPNYDSNTWGVPYLVARPEEDAA